MRNDARKRLALAALTGLGIAGCNAMLGLGGYDFEHDGGAGNGGSTTTSSSSSSSSSSSGSSSSSSSSSGGGGGGGGAGGGDAGPDVIDAGPPRGNATWALGFGAGTLGGMGVDGAGNVYLTGGYTGTVSLPGACAGQLPPVTDTSQTWGFLIKLDSTGACQWATSFGIGTAGSVAAGTAIAVQDGGAFAIAGRYNKANTTGAGLPALTGPKAADAFVVRYPAAWDPTVGVPSSVQRLGDDGDQIISALAFDGANNLYAAGSYQANLKTMIGGDTLTYTCAAGGTCGFLVQLDSTAGTAKATTSSRYFTAVGATTTITSVAYGIAGAQVALGGFATGTSLDLGKGLATLAGKDGFWGLYGTGIGLTATRVEWLSNGYDAQVRDVALDLNNTHLYASATYQGSITLSGGSTLDSPSSPTAVLMHYDDTGAFQQSIQFGTADPNQPGAGVRMALEPTSHDVFFAGSLTGNIKVQSLTKSLSGYGVVAGRITSNFSDALWLQAWQGSGAAAATALAFDPSASGGVVIAGNYSGDLTLDGADPLPNQPGGGLFIAKLVP